MLVKLINSVVIFGMGLVTAMLAVALEIGFSRLTGYSLTGFSLVFIPIGAVICGGLATSGFYFGSIYLHRPANGLLLLQMIVVSIATLLCIYWVGYASLRFPDGKMASDVLPFSEYVKVVITTSHYHLSRALMDVGEVGRMGYVLVALKFFGLAAGGFINYLQLRSKLVCTPCDTYFRRTMRDHMTFDNTDDALAYYRKIAMNAKGQEVQAMNVAPSQPPKSNDMVFVKVENELLCCPKCHANVLHQKAQVKQGNDWKEIKEMVRTVEIAPGVDTKAIL